MGTPASLAGDWPFALTATQVHPWWRAGLVRRYVTAYGLDALADGAFFVLLGWVAVHSMGQASAVGTIAAASALKLIVLVLVGGALGDRFGSLHVARVTLVGRVGVLLALGAGLHWELPGWVLLLLAGLYGVLDGAHDPAIEALSTEVEGAPHAQRGLQGALTTVREVGLIAAGPAVGGVIVATSATLSAVLIASFLAAAWVLVLGLRAQERPAAPVESPDVAGLFKEARTGWVLAWRMTKLRGMLLIFFAANVALTPPVVVGIPLMAKNHEWTAIEFGAVSSGYALGALGGGLMISRWGDHIHRPIRAALLSLLPTALAIGVVGWVSPWWICLILVAIAGISTGVGPSLLGGSIKEATPSDLMSRIQASRATAIVAGAPVGYALFAATAAVAGVAGALSALAIILGAAVLAALVVLAEKRPLP